MCAADAETLWKTAKINPRYKLQLDRMADRYKRNKETYDRIQAMVPNGVPSKILFGLHYRESDNSFACHPHEGSPLTHRTRFVPKGRIPGIKPPYTFLQSARDAYYDYEHLDKRSWQSPRQQLTAIENFNGSGYRRRGIPSPYVWSGTQHYRRGKFVADGRFDPMFVDKQLGVASIMLRLGME